jgi:rhodanese-related sulfurtransferase
MDKKKFLKHFIFIIILSVLSGVIYNIFSRNRIPFLYEPIKIDPGKKISLVEAYSLYREGKAIFIDTRSEEEYIAGHIMNAINIPSYSSMDELILLTERYPADQLMITYCDGVECSSSERLAGILMQIGFPRVLVFYSGWEEWEVNGYPIVKGQENENDSGN